jgi:Tfp pilus assembly protein FimT
MELLVVIVIIGILSGIVINARPWYENPLKNSQDRLNSAIKAARTRAITTTSTYRINADPDNPDEAIQIQKIKGGSCQNNATLIQDVGATDTTITVSNINGFAIGDRLSVGGTTADVLSVDYNNGTMTLGAAVGEKSAGATVETIKDWKNDSAFLDEDLNINKKSSATEPDIVMDASFDPWSICISSRGIVRLFDASGVVDDDLDLVLTNTRTDEKATVTIQPGGAMSN